MLRNQGTYGRIEFSLDYLYGCNEGHKGKWVAKMFAVHLFLTKNSRAIRR